MNPVQGRNHEHAVFSPDGSRAYVACELANTVHVIDMAARKTLATIPAGRNTAGIAVLPGGRQMYASNRIDGAVTVIDTASARRVADIAVGQLPWGALIR